MNLFTDIIIVVVFVVIKYIYIAQGRTMLQMRCVNSYTYWKEMPSVCFWTCQAKCPVLTVRLHMIMPKTRGVYTGEVDGTCVQSGLGGRIPPSPADIWVMCNL